MKIFEKKNEIRIEEDDLQDAKLSSLDFSDESVRKRAFINVLGARLAMKMLFSQKIQANNLYSLYTIHNVIEELDIADIYFQGIKIDVRLVFNRDEIFIPKSHFQYGLLPDLYLVLELAKDFSSAEFLGFFEPKTLNKQNSNKYFYFYEYEKLNDPKTIKTFLNDFITEDNLDNFQDNLENAEELFMSLADKEISQANKGILFRQLAKDISLREKMVEFENFEILAKEAVKNDNVFDDKVLDIVGTQQLFENEDLNQLESEPETETIEEVLGDLLEINEETDETQRCKDAKMQSDLKDKDENYESMHTNIFTSENSSEIESENESNEKDNLGALSAGIAIGGAIAGGAAAAASAVASAGLEAESILIKGSAEVVSAGVRLVSDLVKDAAETEHEIIHFEQNIVEDEIVIEPSLEEGNEEIFEEEVFKDLAEFDEKIDKNLVEEEKEEPNEEPSDNFVTDLAEFDEKIESNLEETGLYEPVELPKYEMLEELPELENTQDLKGMIEEKYFGNLEKKEEQESSSEVINLDDFDFDTLSSKQEPEEAKCEMQNAKSEKEIGNGELEIETVAQSETASSPTLQSSNHPFNPSAEDDLLDEQIRRDVDEIYTTPKATLKSEEGFEKDDEDDEDALKKFIALEEEEEELTKTEEPDDEEDAQDKSDDFIAQVDEFLKDIESSGNQVEFLEEVLTLDLEEGPISSMPVPKVVEAVVSSNSVVENFKQGNELFIEEFQAKDDKTELNFLFKEEEKNDNISDLPVEDKKESFSLKDRKMVIAASIVSVAFASLVIGGSIVHNKNNDVKLAQQTNSMPVTAQGQYSGNLTQQDNMADLSMNQQTSDLNLDTLSQQTTPGSSQEAETNRDMGKAVSDAFLSEPVNANISKVAWEVPEDLAYNDGFRKYLQIAGKNLKLNLQNNLLLATEMAYSNKIVLDLTISRDGSLLSENLATSSGSKQIDKIVLQSVKETLMYLKMPSSELGSSTVNATLIINF